MSDENDSDRPNRPGTGRAFSAIFKLPTPVKCIFDKFPLETYSANALPHRSPRIIDTHILHVFTTKQGALEKAPSFNPVCLKWQAYLEFSGIRFKTVAANNHASPTGVLPFLIPANGPGPVPSSQPIPASKLSRWVTSQAGLVEKVSDMRYEAYISLIDHRIRSAWLFTLYLDSDNAEVVAKQLYIYPTSSNPFVQATIYHQLKQAARAELLKTTSYIIEDEIYSEAGNAFMALSALLGDDMHFFGSDRPTLFDASIFAYTHLLLDQSLNWTNTRLADSLKSRKNLVLHRQRLLNTYFSRYKR